MIPFEQAQSIIKDHVNALDTESVSLLESNGRVLAVDVTAHRDVPVGDMSAMDGFACRASDREMPLTVIDTIAAGDKPEKKIGPGQCSRIMTGAMLPQGADCVVMFEDTEEADGMVRVKTLSDQWNVRRSGEDLKKGDLVLKTGTRIHPAIIALLATEGHDPVTVFRQPKVGIIATGDEVIEPKEIPKDFQIRNSNSYQLHAQIQQVGCLPTYYGIASDTPESIGALFDKAVDQCDVILLSGGVSAGDYDYVIPMLNERNVRIHFHGVAVKPGKPTLFADLNETFIFGLPGNPVSTLIIFEMLVKPFLYGIMGHDFQHRRIQAKLKEDIRRKKSRRLEFIPVVLSQDNTVRRVPYHGSAHINAYTHVNGVTSIPKGVLEMEKGAIVEVLLV